MTSKISDAEQNVVHAAINFVEEYEYYWDASAAWMSLAELKKAVNYLLIEKEKNGNKGVGEAIEVYEGMKKG